MNFNDMDAQEAMVWRGIIERAYRQNPRQTQSDLNYLGLHGIRTQLDIDAQTGRLAENNLDAAPPGQ